MADSSPSKHVETFVEKALFASRWLLAPFYFGLAISLIVLLIKFLAELLHLLHGAFTLTESDVILGVLALVDLCLTASLLIIVIFSGYENFVSRIDHTGHKDWPAWMGTIDFSGLKLKLLSSIVAISAIQLLKQFMSLKSVSDRELAWSVGIHVVFVISSILLALSDRIAGHDSGTDLWSGQVDEDPDVPAQCLCQFSHPPGVRGMRGHVGVRSVQPHHVHSRCQQLPHGSGLGRGRSDRRHDLRSTHSLLLDQFVLPGRRPQR